MFWLQVDSNSVSLTELQVKLDETEQMALKGGKKQLHKLETRVSGYSQNIMLTRTLGRKFDMPYLSRKQCLSQDCISFSNVLILRI